jgi:hypothetical protein
MKKVLFTITIVILLAASVETSDQNSQTPGTLSGVILPKKKGDVPPHIRKCVNVSCETGF